MKKIFFVLAIAVAIVGFGPALQADDSSDAYNESLVKYRYETDEGKKTFTEVVTYKHLSGSVRSQSNECWWDYNEFMNCQTRDKSVN